MTSFLSTYDRNLSDSLAAQKRTKETVVKLLEHIAQGLGEEGMPSREGLVEIKEEGEFGFFLRDPPPN